MKRTAVLLMVITIASKVFGFMREIVLSYFYGASSVSDAYLISLTIPSVIFGFIGVGISTGYIPMYSKVFNEKGMNESNKYTNNLVNLLIIFCSIIVALGLLFTKPIVKLFASGFEGKTLSLAVQFTKIGLTGMYFTGIISIFTAFLQLKNNYVVPALVGFPMNLVAIITIIVSSKTQPWVLAIGSVLSLVAQLLLVFPFVCKEGYRYKPYLDIRDEYILDMAKIALPVIFGTSVNQINVLVDRTLASGIAIGGISALNYANRVNGFVQGMVVTSISTVMYPMISKMAAEGNIKGLKSSVGEAINLINLLVIPATVGAMLFAEPIVDLLFGRGAFDAEAINMTSSALFYYSLGMVGYGLRQIMSRAFYSMQDTKTPVINATLAVVLNIVLNIILSRFLGISGLALATSISALVCTFLLFVSFRRKMGAFGLRDMVISGVKIVIASLLMGVIAKISNGILLNYLSSNFALLISILIGACSYFIIILFMKIKEVDTMISTVKRKLGLLDSEMN